MLPISLALLLLPDTGSAAVVASDNADSKPYPASNFQPGDNGGFGFTPWCIFDYGTPGARFVTQAIGGGRCSWGASGTCTLGRGLTNSLPVGTWRALAMHDPDNTTFSGFNLKTSTQSGFAAGELLRFGIHPRAGNYAGGGVHVSTNRGATWLSLYCGWNGGLGETIEYVVTWDGTGNWWLSVNNLDESVSAQFVGVMAPGAVAMLGVATSGAGLAEGLTFDGFAVSSEPDTAPRLAIRRQSSTNVVVSWPAPGLGWHLQQAVSLTATNWQNVAQSPQPAPGGWQVVLPAPPLSVRFYRLTK